MTWFDAKKSDAVEAYSLLVRDHEEVVPFDFGARATAAARAGAAPAKSGRDPLAPFAARTSAAEPADLAHPATKSNPTHEPSEVVSEEQRRAHEARERAERLAAEAARAQRNAERAAEAAREAAALAQQRIDEAYARGRADGEAEARDEAQRQAREAYDEFRHGVEGELAAVADGMARFRGQQLVRMREGAIQLARVLAQQLLQVELRFHPEALLSVATSTIGECVGLGDLKLSVHPDALEGLTERLSELTAAHPDPGAAVQLVPDDRVAYGSCVARSDRGAIHDDLDDRLERLVGLLWMRWPLPDGEEPESNRTVDVPAVDGPSANDDTLGEEESA